jgi:FkbM family methyltransferase
MTTLSTSLQLRHRIATSALSGPLGALRDLVGRAKGLLRPELALLHYEDAMRDACLRRIIQPHWHCVDVGAHVGSVSYTLSRLSQAPLTIIEAMPAKAAALRARFPLATVHQVAVSDAPGDAMFHENLSASGFSSLSDRANRGRTRSFPVKLAPLDDLLGQTQVDFIKVDIEGHEPAALRGATQMIRRCHPVILFEAGAVEDADIDAQDYDAMFQQLIDLGYAIRPVFHQFYNREAIDLAAFNAARRYPFTAFNFFATPKVNP